MAESNTPTEPLGLDPWKVDPTELGLVIDQCLRDLVNCWVRGQVPTKEQAGEVTRAQGCLAYLQARARSAM